MTRPNTSSKLLLVADPRHSSGAREGTPLRRYRIARLRFDGPELAPDRRFEYLKRVYD